MRILIQRCSMASVRVEGKITGEIETGLLALCGFEPEDTKEDMDWMFRKLVNMRLFPDENDVMNLSLQDINGELLIVSQFTLHASTKKGNRPSYIRAAKPDEAEKMYNEWLDLVRSNFRGKVASGIFGAMMQVELVNDGPVTIWLDSKNKE